MPVDLNECTGIFSLTGMKLSADYILELKIFSTFAKAFFTKKISSTYFLINCMTTYITILRGINVGGHKSIKMEALRQMFTRLGFLNVQTYIQSGNVIFQNPEITDTQLLENKIKNKISENFGFEISVLVLTLNDLENVVENNPFLSDNTKDPAYLHITFFSSLPEKAFVDKINAENYNADEFVCSRKNIYLYCPNGYGKTKLTNTFLETKLKVAATTRNWKTVNELVVLAEKLSE